MKKNYFYPPQLFRTALLIFSLPFFITFFYSDFCYSQTPGQWTWMHGDSTTMRPGVFGTQGVASPSNDPPSVYEACEWTDKQGNFWIYGGQPGAVSFYDDLWKYDPGINEWTWINGNSF